MTREDRAAAAMFQANTEATATALKIECDAIMDWFADPQVDWSRSDAQAVRRLCTDLMAAAEILALPNPHRGRPPAPELRVVLGPELQPGDLVLIEGDWATVIDVREGGDGSSVRWIETTARDGIPFAVFASEPFTVAEMATDVHNYGGAA